MTKEQIIKLLRPQHAEGEEIVCPHCDGEGEILKVMSSWEMPDDLEEDCYQTCPTCNGTGKVTDSSMLPCIWAIDDPLNYISVFHIAKLIESMKEHERGRHIIDLHGCKSVDLTGAEELLTGLHELRKDGVNSTLMNVPNQFQAVLDAYKTMG